MTPNCIKQVNDLEDAECSTFEGEGPFTSMSVEQLLYAAIKGTSIGEVRAVLETTDWARWIKAKVVN